MQLALYNDIVVEAVNEEKDKSKKYVCPECGEEVILRKGEINIPHFAHIKDTVCDGCDMTLTHRYAEQILCQNIGKVMYLKPIKLPFDNEKFNTKDIISKVNSVKTEAEWLNYPGTFPYFWTIPMLAFDKKLLISESILEPRYNGFVPDLELVSSQGTHLFVEIYVRHRVDRDKIDKLKDYGVPTIEIDLSSIQDKFMAKKVNNLYSEIESILFSKKIFDYTTWLVEPELDEELFMYNCWKYVETPLNNYKKFRNAYKFYVFGGCGNTTAEIWWAEILVPCVNNILQMELNYEYQQCATVPENKFMNVRIRKNSCDKLEDNKFYCNWFRDQYVDMGGYNIVNGNIISTVTGEVKPYNAETREEFIKLYKSMQCENNGSALFSPDVDYKSYLKVIKNNLSEGVV